MRKFTLNLLALVWALAACHSTPGAREIEDQPVEVIAEVASPVLPPPNDRREQPGSSSRPNSWRATSGRASVQGRPEDNSELAATTGHPPEAKDPADSALKAKASEASVAGHYRALRYKGVIGGSFAFDLMGSPEEVADMLMNFQGTARHRAWAEAFALKSVTKKATVVTWQFEGKAGINPTVDLKFRRVRGKKGLVVRYKIVKEDFGLAAFFGDYLCETIPNDPRLSKLTERVFIDSGLWIANASKEEVEAGLREDARLLVAWAKELRSKTAPKADSRP